MVDALQGMSLDFNSGRDSEGVLCPRRSRVWDRIGGITQVNRMMMTWCEENEDAGADRLDWCVPAQF